MDSAWNNIKITYCVGKYLGLFPFSGKRVLLPALCSSVLWISLGTVSVSLRNFLISTKFLEGAISVLIATARSKSFFSLVDDFRWFDTYTLRTECRTDQKPQILYLSYALSIEVYVLLVSLFHEHKVNLLLKFTWVIVSVSIMLMITQFVAFVQSLRQRYTTANSLFSSSVNSDSAGTRRMRPKEIANMYMELRNLTEEVKSYYACHVILIILDTVFGLVLCVTLLTMDYYTVRTKSSYHQLEFVHVVLKMLFLFFVVRETHNTVQEARKVVFIAHEALSVTTITSVSKELEVLIMTNWNHPIKFDVYDFFDLDYELLQTIIASMVTYVVVLVQIQLVISDG